MDNLEVDLMKRQKPEPKIALVDGGNDFAWMSCTSISTNLKRAYKKNTRNLTSFFYENTLGVSSVLNLAKRIHDFHPTKIIFVDYTPHPLRLLAALDAVWKMGAFPELIFHVYGDFTYFAFLWFKMEPLLKGKRCKFICSSPKQTGLIKTFISDSLVFTCPFPIDSDIFFHKPESRPRLRKQFGFSNSDFIAVYSGRISLQKNVVELVKATANVMALEPRVRLVLAGPFDDLGAPFFGIVQNTDEYMKRFNDVHQKLPRNVRKRIEHVGNLTPKELSELYGAADCFISLSLHHDEDFGMSPGEALLCGLPLILSDWGGYSQFVQDSPSTLIPVRLTKLGLAIDFMQMETAFLRLAGSSCSSKTKTELSHVARRTFSIDAVANILSNISDLPSSVFSTFSPILKKLALLGRKDKLYYPKGPTKDSFYETIYSSYL